ncbi:trans-resveratrol di-O-methyltransferase-like [Jatropha curcas]|uniref:trans-resveratrol di-O-methyltransferase-like n=1 Tax=Jatropha curcas TaxID=180498 RepID=UPI001895118E|nr:trans-resveratrol di-O-methyltransferase-like isoform X2 [Jatropha curcas]XP_037493184.1 trans-resveratrol di-O-methyltransferase-like [Jatropha curcas]
MALVTEENVDELLKAQTHMWNHTLKFIKSMSLKCAVELGIPDVINNNHGQPMPLSDLVSALQVNPAKTHHVYRLMRLLVHSGFFSLQEEGYLLTPSSVFLLKDTSFNSIPFISLMLDPILMDPFTCLSKWLKNDDQTPFVTAFGESLFEYAGHDIRANNMVNQATASDSIFLGKVVTVKCKEVFEGLDSLVDVAGGTGYMARAIAKAFPNIKCTVSDLPHVVAVADSQGAENLNFVAGDMLQAVPPADAALIKWVLHDWADEDCLKILKNCKEAITKNGKRENNNKVIIIDMVMGNQTSDDDWTEAELLFDMEEMACLTGKQRDEEEWAKLFFDAGFTKYKINYVLGPRALIEVYP